jgi:hypothetical protein
VGSLPAQLAALNRSNIAVQAVLHKDREAAFHACAVDPLTASVLSLKQIRSMFNELWEAGSMLSNEVYSFQAAYYWSDLRKKNVQVRINSEILPWITIRSIDPGMYL